MHFIATLAGRAAEAGLPFLLIGGNAVIAYGYPRHTNDIDLLIRDTDRRAWDALVMPLGFRQYHIHRSFHMYAPTSAALPPVDFMLVDVETFGKLSAGSREITIGEATVRIPSLAHLIALKLHALRSGGEHRRGLDLSDVVELVRINRVDLASAEYREILDRYATDEIREQLARFLARLESPGA